MSPVKVLLPPAFGALFTVAQQSLNQTTHTFNSTLNQIGGSLAQTAQPYHEDIRMLGDYLGAVPYHLLIFLHGLYTASNMHALPFRPYWLLCFWMSLLSGYGGGTWTNLMLQEPLLWCRDDWVLPLFATAWWIALYSPRDIGLVLCKIPVVKVVCRSAAAILRARVIMSRLELSVQKFSPNSLVAPLFLGTLGGCAGKMTVDLALFCFDPSFRTPEILNPGWFMRSGFLVSVFYMGTVHWLHILPKDVAFILIISALMSHGLMEEIFGRAVDLTAPFGQAFHAITRIPLPPQNKAGQRKGDKTPEAMSIQASRSTNGEHYRKKKVS